MFSFLWRWLGLQCVLGERLNTSGGWTVIIFFSMVECPTFSLAWLALSRQAVYRPTDRRLERARRRLVSALVSGVQHVRYLGGQYRVALLSQVFQNCLLNLAHHSVLKTKPQEPR